MFKLKYFLLFALIINVAFAKTQEIYPFANQQQRQTFTRLSNELRCMVCQNQNLTDSNADLAITMRNKIYQMVIDGQSEDEIKAYMQQRYGDFILLTPPNNHKTSLLWAMPFIILLLGGLTMLQQYRLHTAKG